jgi:hypothetical protein
MKLMAVFFTHGALPAQPNFFYAVLKYSATHDPLSGMLVCT